MQSQATSQDAHALGCGQSIETPLEGFPLKVNTFKIAFRSRRYPSAQRMTQKMVVNDGLGRGAAWDALEAGGRNKQHAKKNRASAERDRRRTAGL